MQEKILSPGDPIQARCTKCKQNTDSTIVSMAENAPEKVQCSVCSRKHKYRPPIEAKKPTKRVPVQRETERKQWQALVTSVDHSKATDYSMTATYKLKTVVNHPAFGLGLVQRVVGPQKIEILFESGKKMMRCK